MTKFNLLVFIGYLPVFAIAQQIIGRHRARNITWQQQNINLLTTEWSIRAISFLPFMVFSYNFERTGFSNTMSLQYVRLVGMIMVPAGIVVSMWAQRALGRNWAGGAALHKGHRLVQDGPFKYVRHPVYAGMLISAIGQALTALNIWLALFALLFWCSYSVRVPLEELLLQKKFKKKWERYAASTGMFIPRIRK